MFDSLTVDSLNDSFVITSTDLSFFPFLLDGAFLLEYVTFLEPMVEIGPIIIPCTSYRDCCPSID